MVVKWLMTGILNIKYAYNGKSIFYLFHLTSYSPLLTYKVSRQWNIWNEYGLNRNAIVVNQKRKAYRKKAARDRSNVN